MKEITKNSKWCKNTIKVVKRLKRGYTAYCRCGKKVRISERQLRNGINPCGCEYSEMGPVQTKVISIEPKEMKYRKRVIKKLEDLNSVFDNEVVSMQKLLTTDTDGAASVFQKKSLALLMEMIPIAETKYRKYGGTQLAYALNSLISQARELIADLHNSKQFSELAVRLGTTLINPAFINIAHNMVNSSYSLKKQLEPHLKDGRSLTVSKMIDETTKATGLHLEESYSSLCEKIVKEFER